MRSGERANPHSSRVAKNVTRLSLAVGVVHAGAGTADIDFRFRRFGQGGHQTSATRRAIAPKEL